MKRPLLALAGLAVAISVAAYVFTPPSRPQLPAEADTPRAAPPQPPMVPAGESSQPQSRPEPVEDRKWIERLRLEVLKRSVIIDMTNRFRPGIADHFGSSLKKPEGAILRDPRCAEATAAAEKFASAYGSVAEAIMGRDRDWGGGAPARAKAIREGLVTIRDSSTVLHEITFAHLLPSIDIFDYVEMAEPILQELEGGEQK